MSLIDANGSIAHPWHHCNQGDLLKLESIDTNEYLSRNFLMLTTPQFRLLLCEYVKDQLSGQIPPSHSEFACFDIHLYIFDIFAFTFPRFFRKYVALP